jgi:hypothetical protein
MATTTNYGWTTPDDTDLVKDGAAAIRTLGSSADTTVKNLSPGTTAGDLDYYTSGTAKARLGIGTAGQVLQVNSGATAPEWAAAGGGTSYSLISTTSLDALSTLTLSGIDAEKIFIMVQVNATSTTNTPIQIRLNGDTGAHYSFAGNRVTPTTTYSAAVFAATNIVNATSFELLKGSTTSGAGLNMTLEIEGCKASSGYKKLTAISGTGSNGGLSFTNPNLQGVYESSAAITSLTIFTGAGTFQAGTGIKLFTSN